MRIAPFDKLFLLGEVDFHRQASTNCKTKCPNKNSKTKTATFGREQTKGKKPKNWEAKG